MVCVSVECASVKEETLFVAAENEPIKARRLLQQLNKKKVTVAAGEAPGERKRQRGWIIPGCSLPSQVAARLRPLGWTLLALGRVYLLPLYPIGASLMLADLPGVLEVELRGHLPYHAVWRVEVGAAKDTGVSPL